MVKHPSNPPQPGSSAGPASAPSQLGTNSGRAGTYSQTGSVNPLSQEGVQAVQLLIPRQAVLTLSHEGVQALIPGQAVLISSSARGSVGSVGSLSQAGQSLSPSQGTSGNTLEDATSSPDNTAGITREQGPIPRGDTLNVGLL